MQNSPKSAPQVPCPTCATMTVFAPENPWRPFCSQRCKHIDLGAWASEDFRVAVEQSSEDAGVDD